MLGNQEFNTPATAVTLANNGGNTAPLHSNAFYFFQNGQIVGPTVANTAWSLAGLTIEAGKTAFIRLHVRFNGTAFVYEIAKSAEQDNAIVSSIFNQNYSLVNTKTNSEQDVKPFEANKAYTTADVIRYQMNLYTPVANFTSGTSFVASDWTFVTSPVMTPRAVVGYLMIVNGTASQFVGGTTLLNAANITSVYIPQTPITAQ